MALCLLMTVGFWSCNDEDVDGEEPVLSVDPTALSFASSGDELTKSFNLISNREWSVEVVGEDQSWVSISATKGEGNATLQVTVLPNAEGERSVNLKITSSINTASVSIVQAAGNGSVGKQVILDENMGNENAVQENNKWPNVSEYAGWKKGGSGAENVTYKSSNATVRANSFSNDSRSTSDYSKNVASGGNNILLKGGATMDVCGIMLTESQTKLRLTFGIERNEYGNYDAPYKTEEFTVALSADGEKWSEPITYTRSDYSSWDLATADFTLSKATTKLYVRFKAVTVDGRIDDITLTTGEGGQVVDLDQASGGGDEENDGTVENYPTQVVSSFTDVFATAENNKLYASSQWGFYSNDKQYATNSAYGWQGKTFNEDKYIAVAPFNSTLTEVVAYAIMSPFDVKAAANKTLSFDLAWYYKDNYDDSKLEVVASTDFAGNVKTANWSVVKDCTFATDAALNNWVSLTADLSAYANNNKVYVAFRYTGKANTYRLDNVAFGTEIGISFGAPAFEGNLKAGMALNGAKLSIPYFNAKGTETYEITVAVAGEAAGGISPINTPVTKTLAAGDGTIELEITGTPVSAGKVIFTIDGIDGLTENTVEATVGQATSGDVYLEENFSLFDDVSEEYPNANSKNIGAADGVEIPGTEIAELPGWSGTLVYKAQGMLKMGGSKKKGSVVTPALTAISGTQNVVVTFDVAAWKNDDTSITVALIGSGNIEGNTEVVVEGLPNDGASALVSKSVTISGAASDTRIVFKGTGSKPRFFLDNVKVEKVK